MLPGHVYLFNSFAGDLSFELDKPVSVVAPTLRRDRTIQSTIHIRRASMLDLTKQLGIDKTEAEVLLEMSPSAQRLIQLGWMKVLDADHVDDTPPPPKRTAADFAKVHETERKIQKKRMQELRLLPVAEQTLMPKNEVLKTADPVMQRGKVDDGDDASSSSRTPSLVESASALTPTTGPDPNAIEQLVDSIPSTRWSYDRLLAYAKSHSIPVKEGASKNALLRSIRNR